MSLENGSPIGCRFLFEIRVNVSRALKKQSRIGIVDFFEKCRSIDFFESLFWGKMLLFNNNRH